MGQTLVAGAEGSRGSHRNCSEKEQRREDLRRGEAQRKDRKVEESSLLRTQSCDFYVFFFKKYFHMKQNEESSFDGFIALFL